MRFDRRTFDAEFLSIDRTILLPQLQLMIWEERKCFNSVATTVTCSLQHGETQKLLVGIVERVVGNIAPMGGHRQIAVIHGLCHYYRQ